MANVLCYTGLHMAFSATFSTIASVLHSVASFLCIALPCVQGLGIILSRAREAGSPVKPFATAPTQHGPDNPLVR